MMSDTETLKLAVIGAGAVVEMRYLPAAARTENVEVTHVVDLDMGHARSTADAFGIPAAASDYRDVLEAVDAVVVATPPSSHASIAIDALDRGVHVLCEKPLTADAGSARELVRAAERSDALLSVAMVRRVGTAVATLRRFMNRGLLGRIQSVEAEEGGEFNWPLRTGHIFESPSQGGVLRDTGTHLIDLVLWVTSGCRPRLVSYEDDSWGGAEANARATFDFDVGEESVAASVEVSFTRGLANRLRVVGEGGILESTTSGGVQAVFVPADSDVPIALQPEGAVAGSRTDDFIRQLEAFATAVRAGGPAPVPAAQALETVELIESCYSGRSPTVRRWQALPEPAARS
jgi:predicted dehydrogenase